MHHEPLVSIVTPTFPGRERVLLERCMPSVYRQDWPSIEFVVVSDENPKIERLAQEAWRDLNDAEGRDPDSHLLPGWIRRLRVVQINDTWKNDATKVANGAVPWLIGSWLALGEFISPLGDDDELLPLHVRTHVETMRATESTWSVSKVEFRANGEFWQVIGDASLAEGHMDATGIMCWKGALNVATWDPAAGIVAVDWKLVDDWRNAGLRGEFIDQVTGVHHDGWVSGMTGKPYDPVA